MLCRWLQPGPPPALTAVPGETPASPHLTGEALGLSPVSKITRVGSGDFELKPQHCPLQPPPPRACLSSQCTTGMQAGEGSSQAGGAAARA